MADALKMSARDVYQSMTKGGIISDYIVPCYDVLHTFSREYIVEDLVDLMTKKGVLKAVANINDVIAPAIIGMSDGTVTVNPMDNNAIRVQFTPNGIELPRLENLIYTETPDHHYINCSQNLRGQVIIRCEDGNLICIASE